ncbi:MAG: Do family serine endopeptidase [Candidatus Acidoferrales bacterium]
MAIRWGETKKWEFRLAVGGTLAVGILLGTLISNGVIAERGNRAPSAEPLTVPSPVELSSAFAEVARKVEPAVVNIRTEAVVRNEGRRRLPPRSPDSFREFFDRFFEFGPQERFQENSLGSGVIVDEDGYILTNNHVIRLGGRVADEIEVSLTGGDETYPAEVVGFDEETDLAVLKIDAGRKLTAARLGNSDAIQVGDWVLAIGSPFGLDATVTAGIISYKGRTGMAGMQQFQSFIQTDAAINHGNSGGPLVNLAGEVIGINTAIITQGPLRGGYAGIGFALASNIAVEVYNEIIEHGRMVRGSIGVSFRGPTSQNEAILRSLGAEHGVVIESVQPGGPAEKAGLRRGDVIIQVGDAPIYTGDDLVNKVASTPIGQEVSLGYIRNKQEQQTKVRIEDRTKVFADRFESTPGVEREEEASARLGITLEEMSAALAHRFGLSPNEAGLLVTDVEPGSFGSKIGLQRADVILEFNQQPVRSLRAFRALQQQVGPGGDVVFWLKRRAGGDWVGLYLGGTLPQ